MTFSTERTGSTLIVKLCGEIDQHCASEIRDDIDREIDIGSHVSTVILDLKNVGFMDSSGLGMIMGRYRKISAMGGRLVIENPKPQVDKVLELAGIKKLLSNSAADFGGKLK